MKKLDTIFRTLTVVQQAGIKALLVHALSEQTKLFYKYHGFYKSTNNSMTLLITLDDAIKSVADLKGKSSPEIPST